jgi:hypothetical protein
MPHPHTFQHLNILPWIEPDTAFSRYVARRGTIPRALRDADPDSAVWDPATTLEIRLLHLPLFQGCEDTHLRDLRVEPPPTHACRDRDALIMHLALHLCEYENVLNGLMRRGQQLLGHRQVALDRFKRDADMYRALHARGQLPRSRSRPSPRQIASAIETLEHMVELLTPEHYRLWVREAEVALQARQVLGQAMLTTFETYGPTSRRFRQAALWYAIATLLTSTGIELGEVAVVADRLRKRYDPRTSAS